MLYKTAKLSGVGIESISHPYSPGYDKNGFNQVGSKKAPVYALAVNIGTGGRNNPLLRSNLSGLSAPDPFHGLSSDLTNRARFFSVRDDEEDQVDSTDDQSSLSGFSAAVSHASARGGRSGRGGYRPGQGRRGGRGGLRDSYINDNPSLRDDGSSAIATDSIDPTQTPVDPNFIGPQYFIGPETILTTDMTGTPTSATASPSIFGSIGADIGQVFSTLFGSAVSATVNAGTTVVNQKISGAINPPQQTTVQKLVQTLMPTSGSSGKTIMGISLTTLVLGGGAAFLLLRKK